MAKAASKSSPQRKYTMQAAIFFCFDVFPVRSPQKFKVQAKIPTIRPVFPDYLPTSYDDYVSTDKKHWHIAIEQLMQTAHIYTLSVAQHNQLTTNDATIFVINAVICY